MTKCDKYVLDANVFIEASRRYYAFDIAPKFWESLLTHAANGRLCSVDRVLHELMQYDDQLADWTKNCFRQWFLSTQEQAVVQKYGQVMDWVYNHGGFTEPAKRDFAAGADGWIVSYASVHACVLVTQESFKPGIKRKVPIPNVCQQFGVPYIDTFKMMRSLGIVFR